MFFITVLQQTLPIKKETNGGQFFNFHFRYIVLALGVTPSFDPIKILTRKFETNPMKNVYAVVFQKTN